MSLDDMNPLLVKVGAWLLNVLADDEILCDFCVFFLGGLTGTGVLLSSKVIKFPNRTLFLFIEGGEGFGLVFLSLGLKFLWGKGRLERAKVVLVTELMISLCLLLSLLTTFISLS